MSTNTRGACPVLNALANSGIINFTGRNLNSTTIQQISDFTKIPIMILGMIISYIKMMKFFTFNKENFSLDDISDHHVIEHDNSIARYDYSEENKDTYKTKINNDNLNEYLALCRSDGFIYKEDVLQLKKDKYEKKKDASYWFDQVIPNVEVGGLFTVFGKDDRISKEDFIEIFANERIPDHFLHQNN